MGNQIQKPVVVLTGCEGVDKRLHFFPKSISPKVNVIARLGFELVCFEAVVRHVSNYAPGTSTTGFEEEWKMEQLKRNTEKNNNRKKKNQIFSVIYLKISKEKKSNRERENIHIDKSPSNICWNFAFAKSHIRELGTIFIHFACVCMYVCIVIYLCVCVCVCMCVFGRTTVVSVRFLTSRYTCRLTRKWRSNNSSRNEKITEKIFNSFYLRPSNQSCVRQLATIPSRRKDRERERERERERTNNEKESKVVKSG